MLNAVIHTCNLGEYMQIGDDDANRHDTFKDQQQELPRGDMHSAAQWLYVIAIDHNDYFMLCYLSSHGEKKKSYPSPKLNVTGSGNSFGTPRQEAER